jgi:tRNA(fMet)-specific endonuclease VapC
MIFVLDTNTVSYILREEAICLQNFTAAIRHKDQVLVPSPVYFEVKRGLIWRYATRQIERLDQKFMPNVERLDVIAEDWDTAAQLWADAVTMGKQLSDVDLLLAALAQRLGATIATSDDDFDAFPVRRVDWRVPQST